MYRQRKAAIIMRMRQRKAAEDDKARTTSGRERNI